jgi:outer membrane protein insertion porin family
MYMNSKRNKKILVMMVTSALMTCPAWASADDSATTNTAVTTAADTGYEPATGEAIPGLSTDTPVAAKTTPTVKKVVQPKVAKTVSNDTAYTGYETAEELAAAGKTQSTTTEAVTAATTPAAQSSAGTAAAQSTRAAAAETGYESTEEQQNAAAGTTEAQPAATTESGAAPTAEAPAATTPAAPAEIQNTLPGKKVAYLPGTADAVIDMTTLPKYPVATLSQAEQAALPYGTAVSDADLQPYIGKVATSVSISPLPDQKLEDMLQRNLAMRVGDAVNADYIRHDVNIIGAAGLFSTVTPSFTPVPEGVNLDYKVNMNPVVNKIDITGNESYSTDQILKQLAIKPGMTLNTILVSKDVAAVNSMFGGAGYFMSRVANVNMDDQGVLHLGISEGRLQDIIVKGNTKTKTYVIMRELKIKKGQIFNKNLASRSIERIYNTGYFEDVNVRLLPGKTRNDVIMEIDVTEQKTGQVTIGAGYSDSDGLVGILGLSESNLRGTGDKISINWEFGGTTNSTRNYIFSYTRPWINDHGDSLGFSIFDRESDYDDYDQKGNSVAEYYKRTKGGNITYGRVRSEYVKDFVTLETKSTDYTKWRSGFDYSEDYDSYLFKTNDYLGKNFGRTNSLTWSHVFDNRDNVYDPTRGKRLSFTGAIAGHGLGGDFDFYKFIAESRTYYKVGRAHVIAVRLMGGVGFGDMPYSDLFTLGGADTIRGYEDDEFRGNRFYEGTVEYRFPMAKKV